jgi:hypothetical protein
MKKPGAWALVTMVALVVVLAAAACGDDDSGQATNSVTAGDVHMSAAPVLVAINMLDSAGLHAMDTSITQDGKIPSTAHTTAVHLQTLVLVTGWPNELKDPAKKLAVLLGDFAAAIDTDKPDMKKAAEASNKVHAGEHDFSKQVWEYLAKEAGLKGGSDTHAESAATPSPAAAKIQVTDATARATTNDVSAVYFTVKNPGPADRLVKAAVDASVAQVAQLHTMVTEGATARMQQVDGIDVPAGGEVVLKPGGYHVMLMNVQKPLKEGDSVPVTLTFEKGGTVQVIAAVKTLAGGGMN